jgi:hypothetical protein
MLRGMALRQLDEHDLGLTWVVDEPVERASHALSADGRVWLVDPVDEPQAIERAQALGDVAGVLQLLDRHNRDGEALATRLGVPLNRVPAELPGTPFEVRPLVSLPVWREVALWWPQRRGLVVAEVLGTHPLWALGRPAGVHPMARMLPPRSLGDLEPEHLLVGHGAAIHGPAAAAAVREALAHSRGDLPRLAAQVPAIVRGRGR